MAERIKMEYLPWEVKEKPYQPERNIYYETIFTLGNGYMGVRGCLEEGFEPEDDTYPGIYIAGIYDNYDGEYVELVNCPEIFGVDVWIGQHKLDMKKGKLVDYTRCLNMHEGTLTREFVWVDPDGNSTKFYWQRFISMSNVHMSCLRLRIVPIDHSADIKVQTRLNGDVFNRRQRDYPPIKRIIPNYHLDTVECGPFEKKVALLHTRTKTTGIDIYQLAAIMTVDNTPVDNEVNEKCVRQTMTFLAKPGQEVGFDKLVETYTSRDASIDEIRLLARKEICSAQDIGYDGLLKEHIKRWDKIWENADIEIEGDIASQQGIRFNIFNLIQANASDDPYVNLPAKLLSHTRYKGNAFWDTEMFMFPFYVFTNPKAARNLLMYRYNMLPGARKNAKRRGLRGAMYPWCSAHDGSEQCETWEYGDCEIHITADVAYALDQYIQATGDEEFLVNYAAEIYIETARFWVDRVTWNPRRGCYTILTVKGPDEYCAITNNNMYTNYMAERNLELAEKAVSYLKENYPDKWEKLSQDLQWKDEELEKWREVRQKMYKNWDKEKNLLIQDDLFMDKQEEDLSKYKDRKMPVLEIIGYERVMRVRILRQADVIHLMYLLNDSFDYDQKLTAFNFYEPLTTHDSSLSYCIHCIMAAELGMREKAFDYFFKTCRLDLDDEMDTACTGLHGASMGGTWQALVNGLGGMRITDGKLSLKPILPSSWNKVTFNIHFQGRVIKATIKPDETELCLLKGEPLSLLFNGELVQLDQSKLNVKTS